MFLNKKVAISGDLIFAPLTNERGSFRELYKLITTRKLSR